LIKQAAGFFSGAQEEMQQHYQTYRTFHKNKGYEVTLGESKTLCFEEAFLLYLSVMRLRPAQIVEIGSQYGKSARRLVDIVQLLGLETRVTCFDLIDELQFISANEVELILQDVTHNFSTAVLEKLAPAIIFLDARPYALLKNVTTHFLEWSLSHPAILAIHDCSQGLFNPNMKIPKTDQSHISSKTGVWERHVLSEVFMTPNNRLDDLTTPSHRLKIFNTPHGLALIAPLDILQKAGSLQ